MKHQDIQLKTPSKGSQSLKDQRLEDFKKDVPKPNTTIVWIPISEYSMVRYGSKNWHQNSVSLSEIVLHAQNILTILGSLVNVIEGTYMTTK